MRRRAIELGEGDRAWVINGLRGVGKTALLNELMNQVSGSGWIVAKVEVSPNSRLPVALAGALARAMRPATGRHPVSRLQRLLGVFKAFSLQVDPTDTVSLGWERATPAQRQLVHAIAYLGRGEPVAIAEVADKMGKRVSDLSVSRRDLIRKGLIYAPERGMLAFTVPGMHAFIAAQE